MEWKDKWGINILIVSHENIKRGKKSERRKLPGKHVRFIV
jgi:hypothetical protein